MKRDKLKDMPCWKRAIYIGAVSLIIISIIVCTLAFLEIGVFAGLKSYASIISMINSLLIITIILTYYKEGKPR